MDEIAVLVLNYTYEPLHFTNARRAVTLLLAGKAESVESSPRVIRSPSRAFPLPAVIRLAAYIRKPFLERVAFNKKNILRRDGYTCQYCSRRGEKLTVDHVMPRSRGGSDHVDQRRRGLPSVQSLQGKPDGGGSPPAAHPRAGAPAVPVLRAPDAASPRHELPRLVAEVSRRGSVLPLSASVPAVLGVLARGGPAARDRAPERAARRGAAAQRPPRHHGQRQDLHARQRHRAARAGPALVISPNKTLAAQLYGEFKAFFPGDAVEYFVSYYDYYQPEAYIPQSDTYIEKDALVNDDIDRMRHSATTSLFERRDVVVVASVSCIYGIGAPETYQGMHVGLEAGQTIERDALIRGLVADPVRAQRRRLPPGDVPGPRRRRGDLSGGRRVGGPPRRAVGRHGREAVDPRSAARGDDGLCAGRENLPGEPLRHAGRPARARGRGHHGRAGRAAALPQGRATGCWRPSGSSSGRSSTWRCCERSATATASRTTRGISPGAGLGRTRRR